MKIRNLLLTLPMLLTLSGKALAARSDEAPNQLVEAQLKDFIPQVEEIEISYFDDGDIEEKSKKYKASIEVGAKFYELVIQAVDNELEVERIQLDPYYGEEKNESRFFKFGAGAIIYRTVPRLLAKHYADRKKQMVSVSLVGGIYQNRVEVLDGNVGITFGGDFQAALPEATIGAILGIDYKNIIKASASMDYRHNDSYRNRYRDTVVTYELSYNISKRATVSIYHEYEQIDVRNIEEVSYGTYGQSFVPLKSVGTLSEKRSGVRFKMVFN